MNSSYFSTSDGVELRYLTWDGSGRGFLMVHGLASNALLWEGLAESLSLNGYRGAAIDQRGHGLSDRADRTMEPHRFILDIEELLSLLTILDHGWTKPILVGQSWGCSVVELFAATYPNLISGLVLVDGGFSDMKVAFPTWAECEAALTPPDFGAGTLDDATRFIAGAHPDWSPRAIASTVSNLWVDEEGHLRNRLSRSNHMAILHNLWEFDPIEVATSITVPVVAFAAAGGEHWNSVASREAQLQAFRAALPGPSAQYVINGDHDLHAQYPEQMREILLRELTDGVLR